MGPQVLYDGEHYYGEVTEISENECRVNCMTKAGAHYKWPEKEDNIFYPLKNIVASVNPPIPVGHRNNFMFN